MTEATHELGADTVPARRRRRATDRRAAGSLPVRTAHPTVLTQAVPWCLLGLLVVGGLGWAGTPAWDIARYTAYWSLAVVLPGMLVFRAVGWRVPGVAEDVAYGSATGLALELVAWAGSVALGLQDWLKLWPGLVFTLFLAVPSLRRHWWRRSDRALPAVWSWLMSGLLALVTIPFLLVMADVPLPPATFNWYQDLLYHLSISEQLTRAVPPQVPQLSGETLHYHWFSHAHMAAGHLITGIPLPTVLLRLWILPLAFVGTLATASVARQCARRWWAGLVAATVAAVSPGLQLTPELRTVGIGWINYLSPSLTYSVVFLMASISGIVVLLRDGKLGRPWLLLTFVLAAASGAKSSVLPVLLAGVVLAALATAVGGRGRLRPALMAVGMVLAVLIGGAGVLTGAARSGVRVGLFHFLEWAPPYRALVDSPTINGVGFGWLPDGINRATGDARVAIAAILLFYLLAHAVLAVGLFVLLLRSTGRDLAAWLVAGTYLGGMVGLVALSHPAQSQLYFGRNVTPVGAVLAGWLLAACVPTASTGNLGRPRRAGAASFAPVLVGAFALGAMLAVTASAFAPTPPTQPDLSGWLHSMFDPFLLVVVGLGLGGAVWAVLRRRTASLKGLGSAALVAAILGLSIPSAVTPMTNLLRSKGDVRAAQSPTAITKQEVEAALWVGRHAGPDDVLATNVHCLPVRTRPRCVALAFWVTGFAGRRAVIEGWGFSGEALAENGKAGLVFSRQPSPFPERLALNDEVFIRPTAANLAALRAIYNVRWLVADELAGPVSADLAELAVKRYERGSVTVYELP